VNQELIILSSDGPIIGKGLYCFCHRHPTDEQLCIKIPTTHKKSRKRQAADRAYYRKIHRKRLDLSHIADNHGICQTNLGEGDLYERISDQNGEISQTVQHYFEEQPSLAPEIIQKLISLGKYLLENHIMIGDLHGRNILLQILNDTESKLMIVDGIGDRVFFTAPNVFPSILRGKIIRRWNRFVNQLQVKHPSINFPKSELYLAETK